MRSKQIREHVYEWAVSKNFTAPYNVLQSEQFSKHNKRRYQLVTFGYARTLDASVEIYHSDFMILRTSNSGAMTFKSLEDLMVELNKLTEIDRLKT